MKQKHLKVTRKTAAIHTLGCKVNQAESAQIAAGLEKMGFNVVFGFPKECADLVIVNTCTVTHKAEAESRRSLLRMAKSGGITVAAGCMAHVSGPQLSRLKEVNHVFDNNQKWRIFQLAESVVDSSPGGHCQFSGQVDSDRFHDLGDGYLSTKTRAAVKVQDGCDSYCSYCIVPYARGSSRSMPIDAAGRRLRSLAKSGYREIVLTGIHLGNYGTDLSPTVDLVELLKSLEQEPFEGRIRLSSLEPTEITDDLLNFLKTSTKICPHFHLPLQSGDRQILERMNRCYTPSEYGGVVERIRSALPDCSLGTDVMVGFPGETEQAFFNTVRLIERLPFSYLHVFPYSPRSGTPAAVFDNQVPDDEKKRRVRVVRELGRLKKDRYFRSLIGRRGLILVQNGPDSEGLMRGLSERYVPVLTRGGAEMINRFIDTRLARIVNRDGGSYLFGEAESV